ncbi:MAG: NAD(P)-dependent dehydrogenase (short-subunit alcohol dehydrogenase family) [Parvibaculaceae bacterium]|jgi:NAD(P)-dependent dehydrogenase (short-subunit alcohol dehydrogenase family)|nr:SDR family NAD(P)-dependent oxidoreductase [Parvibaculaceae bacterium]
MSPFNGKVAVITGAASGIGRALAVAFAQEGASVAISDVDMNGLAETLRMVEAAGGSGRTYQVDVGDRDAVFAFADEVQSTQGGADILINNAGVAQMATVDELTMDDLEWVMKIDYWGMVYGTKAFLPQIKAKGDGYLANVSSIFGIIAVPGQAAYNSAKFAIRGFTEALRHEMKDTSTHIACIHPGGVKTSIVKNARFLQSSTAQDRTDASTNFDKLARTTPEKAAQIILNGLRKRKGRILIGKDARMMDRIQRLFPAKYGSIMFGKKSPIGELGNK